MFSLDGQISEKTITVRNHDHNLFPSTLEMSVSVSVKGFSICFISNISLVLLDNNRHKPILMFETTC